MHKKIWIFMILISTSLLSVVFLYKYSHYLVYYGGCVQEERPYLKVLIKEKDLKEISTQLIINENSYKCLINKISINYIMDNNYVKYYEVFYDCPLLKIRENEIIKLKIDLGKKTIYETLKEKAKKGLN